MIEIRKLGIILHECVSGHTKISQYAVGTDMISGNKDLKGVKFKIITKTRIPCLYFYDSEKLNWAAQKNVRSAGWP